MVRKSTKETCRVRVRLKNAYGITLDEWFRLYLVEEKKCPLCGRLLARKGQKGLLAAVDHEHNEALSKRKRVRGLLCGDWKNGCNYRLGWIEKNRTRDEVIAWLLAALDYVQHPPAREILDAPTKEDIETGSY